MKNLILTLFLLTLIPSGAWGVQVVALKNPQLFGIQVEAGRQEFYGRADSVNSVSLQYYITSAYRVTEMVVDMHGSPLQLRIYHTAFIDPKQEAARLKNKTGVQSVGIPNVNLPGPAKKGLDGLNATSNALLLKEYPLTTHAKTIEFQVGSEQELLDLYQTIRDHWLRLSSETQETTNPDGSTQEKLAPRLNGRLFIVE